MKVGCVSVLQGFSIIMIRFTVLFATLLLVTGKLNGVSVRICRFVSGILFNGI